MTIVVTVKINDGIVLAADSATTFFNDMGNVIKIYNNANKVFNLVKGLPIGTLTYNAGAIGAASIATITKDLRKKLSSNDAENADWYINPANYSMEEVANKVRRFLFEEKFKQTYPGGLDNFFLGYKVCGYGSSANHPELWDVPITSDGPQPKLIHGEDGWGPNWDGEYEAMDRLILGVGTRVGDVLRAAGAPEDQVVAIKDGLTNSLRVPLVLPAMPIQDAIELARFMVETTIRYTRFNLRSETVGGPIEIAVITKHEGFKWVQRKLFFQSDLNPPNG